MYFGNNEGIVEFDGEYFNTIKLNGIRAMTADSAGKIYAGADNELGFLYQDSLGVTKYQSLKSQLPEKLKEFYTVLSIVYHNGNVYFFGLRAIFMFRNDKLVKYWTPETDFRFGFEVYDRIFVRQNEKGLMEIKGDSLVLLPGTDVFKEESVYFMLPYPGDSILLGSRNKGLFLASNNGRFAVKEFKTSVDQYLITKTLYHGILLPDKNYALVTNSGGIIIIDKYGKWVQLYNKETGLAGNALNYVFCDNNKNLWLGSNNGVYYVETNTPITFFDEETGLSDLTVVLKRFQNKLFAGTLNNLYTLSRLEKISPFTKLPYCFIPVSNEQNSFMDLCEDGDQLICASSTDICILKNGIIKSLNQSFFNYLIYPSEKFPGRYYIGCGDGIKYYEKNKAQIEYKGYLKKCNGEVRFIHELQNGDIIYIENYKKINRLKFDNSETGYSEIKENIEIMSDTGSFLNCQLYSVGEMSLLIINHFPYYFNNEQDRFVPADFILNHFDNPEIKFYTFSGETENRIFFSTSIGAGFITKQEDQYNFTIVPMLRLPVTEPLTIFDDTVDHKAWISLPKGVYCYDYAVEKNYSFLKNVIINKVIIGKDSVLSTINNADNKASILYSFNNIDFNFALPFYENIDANEYSCYLEGFSKEWSDWSTDAKVRYTNLHPGSYVFKVKARNCYKTESAEALFFFEILPPWYMMWYAYVFYVLIFLLIIYLAIRVYGKQLKAKNIRLEKIIEERTAEINEKNIELETQNKLITDSIHYAKHIQDAILPNPSELKTLFNDAFVFFLPRDIVSGDFYWFSKQDNKIFIAAGDCTGHGVPGSLMSMMGNTLLNEIVNEKKIYSPAKIFDNLNNSVITLLNQNIEGELTREDGMDISLFCYDTQNKNITIASANHKVIVICDGKELIIKGDIYSIGGMFSVSQTVGFTDHVIPYKPGTVIYLFSDGYYDQFGGKDNSKFMLSNFEKFLIENSEKTMDEQLEIIKNTFNDWKGTYRQIDDILVIGIKI